MRLADGAADAVAMRRPMAAADGAAEAAVLAAGVGLVVAVPHAVTRRDDDHQHQ